MTKTIKIDDWFNIWGGKTHSITLVNNRLNILVGANGTGKTTTLRQLKEKEKEAITFENETDGGDAEAHRRLNKGTTAEVASFMTASEGQRVLQSFGAIAKDIGKKVSEGKDFYVLLDGVDSGMSVDNIRYLKSFFHKVISDCCSRNISVYFVVSSNSYELAKGEHCIDVKTGKTVTFKDYEDWAEFICKEKI